MCFWSLCEVGVAQCLQASCFLCIAQSQSKVEGVSRNFFKKTDGKVCAAMAVA